MRRGVAVAATALLGAALLVAANALRTQAPALHPDLDPDAACPGCDVILVSVDTARGDRLGCRGSARETAPRVCRFFEDHVVFERAMSQSSWTAPAHASMFTGLYPHRHGVNYGPRIPPLEGHPTLFSILGGHGYFRAALHGGGYLTPVLDGRELDYVSGDTSLRGDLVARFEEVVAAKPERAPLLLLLHGFDVHRRYTPRENYFAPHQPELDRMTREGEICHYEDLADGSRRIAADSLPSDGAARRYFEELYDSEILEVDASLGAFFDHLERSGRLERTIVLLTSDHGEEFFERGSCDHVKTLYSEVLHVPLMLRTPSTERRRVSVPVPASISVLPTLLRLVGVATDGLAIDGSDLLAMRDADAPLFFAETSFHYGGERIARFAAVEGGRKLLYDAGADAYEAFDLDADPGERAPLADGQAGLRAELEAYVERSLRSAPDAPAAIDAQTRRQLEALGYLGR